MKYNTNVTIAKNTFHNFNRYLRFKSFLSYVKIGSPDECWIWKGSYTDNNRGQFKLYNKVTKASIAAYRLFIGTIPKRKGKKKLCVCHSCDNPPCVNPNHLWLGTKKQNMEDMVRKGRTRDQRGENNPSNKFTMEEAKEIQKLYASGKYTQKEIGDKFNIVTSTVSRILNGNHWSSTKVN